MQQCCVEAVTPAFGMHLFAAAADEELRKLTPVPFAIGEEFASKWQFLPFIEKGLANLCVLSLCLH